MSRVPLAWIAGLTLTSPALIFVSAALPSELGDVWSFPSVMLGMTAILLGSACAFLLGMAAIAFAVRRAWLLCALALILPCLTILNEHTEFPPSRFTAMAGDVVHFTLMKPSYDARVARLPPPRLHVFVWSGMMDGWNGLVYDQSDEIARDSALWTPSFTRRVKSDHNLRSLCGIEHLWGNYYYATFDVVCDPLSTSH